MDANETRDALRMLTELLPSVAERMSALLAEEMVRTALWFHPGIHWLAAQIQLAREEIVDELTVRAIGDRRTYVEALLAFADSPGLSPAPAFAHPAH